MVFPFWTGSGVGGGSAAGSGGGSGPCTTACGLNGHKKNIPLNALPTTMNHHHHNHLSKTPSTTSLPSSLTTGVLIPADGTYHNPSSVAAALQSDNKYAKRRSQIQTLQQRYRIHYSMTNHHYHQHQRKYMILLVVTIAFTIMSFWIISSHLAANYAGSQEDVRSLQDLADSIRRVRIRRKQALQHHDDQSSSGDNSDGGTAGREHDPTTLNQRYRRHGRDDSLYLPPRSPQQQQQKQQELNRMHRIPRENNAELLGVDSWGVNGDSEGGSGGGGNGGKNNGNHRPAAATTSTTKSKAATTMTKRNEGQPSGSSTHTIYYEPSDHGGDREQPFRLHSGSEDVEEGEVIMDEDEKARLERLEEKIRIYQEINVQEEVRAKRLEDKMAASIEALKEYSSQHQQLQHGSDGTGRVSSADSNADHHGSGANADPLQNLEEESFA